MNPPTFPLPVETVARKKRPLLTLLGVLSVLLFVVLVAAIAFPSLALRYVLSRATADTGIVLTFDRAYFFLDEGSFLGIDGLAVKRQDHPHSNFDLTAKNVRMPAMVPADFYSPVLHISGLRGTIERVGNDSESAAETAPDNFINTLMLIDAEVEFIDRTPEIPFRTTIQIKEFWAVNTKQPSFFEPFTCSLQGLIDTAEAGIALTKSEKHKIMVSQVPLDLFAPYAPVLDDIFEAGSMNIVVDDLTDETQKKLRLALTLLSDCKIKSVDDILAPVLRAALQQLDQSAVPALHELKGKIDRLKISTETLHTKMDKAAQIVDRLKVLAPPEVRQEYEKFKSDYDRAKAVAESWNTLLHDLDQIKANIVNETFQHFIASGRPIEIDLQQENGEWQYDWYEVVVRLVEKNYREIIATQYQRRIQEIREAVERFL